MTILLEYINRLEFPPLVLPLTFGRTLGGDEARFGPILILYDQQHEIDEVYTASFKAGGKEVTFTVVYLYCVYYINIEFPLIVVNHQGAQ